MAIAMVTVFLSSCNKDEINPLNKIEAEEVNENQEDYKELNLFFNEADFANKTDAEIIEYIKNLSSEEIMNRKNDYLVAEYLTSIDLFDSVVSEEENIALLSKMDLSDYVDNQEINDIYTKYYSEEDLNFRGDCVAAVLVIFYECTKSYTDRIFVGYDYSYFPKRPRYTYVKKYYQGLCKRYVKASCP